MGKQKNITPPEIRNDVISCYTCRYNFAKRAGERPCDMLNEFEESDRCLHGSKIMEYKGWDRFENFHFSLWEPKLGLDFIKEEEMKL